jgi:hypothetical protein
MMPEQWYGQDPATYQWQRGDPTPWFLFARDARVRVFVPGSRGVGAQISMRVSRLQVADSMTVAVNGGAQQSVTLGGSAANPQAVDGIAKLEGPPPAPVSFPVALQPGWNEVAFRFHPGDGEREDLGMGVISAAVAPDLSFTRTSTAGTQTVLHDGAFRAFALDKPPTGLAGDPEIDGTVEGADARPAWLAVALADGANVIYRTFPIAQDGAFDINFMHAFPDGWFDRTQRIVGIWFISRGAAPKFSAIYYNLHAMPARALRRPQSLTDLPIRIDGKAIGAAAVFLSAGRHTVASGDRQVKMTLLTLDPVKLPRTKPFALTWQRESPTALKVTTRSATSPFLLVFGEAYHPEWQASLGGEPLPHVIVDGVVNGWIVPSLPEGADITLTFAGQRYYFVAALLSLIALGLMILLACIPRLWPLRASDR